ncbi:ATP-binding response regulator [Noviherbaspirillum galbum]|uniref:histidine kinase n=1 Tax=Noviherbaspirillum galbum TaxID=2709383 RepID=A0A6B3SPH5_9BURK|nr:hybrid sensor histidine kinase/response regulator [Noviherbaspirillum galbum]NEX59629.1 response regulator [Noviherbaspirillum galbum]
MDTAFNILVVDDNGDDRKLTVRALRTELPQATIVEAATASDFDLHAANAYDCVITDFRLGWSDGLAILRRIKQDDPECPVIMFTSTGNEDTCAAGMKQGLSDYIVKRRGEYPKLPVAVRSSIELARARVTVREHQASIEELLEKEKLARKEAEHANHLKDDFLATVSHELRTPLSAVLGWAHMLQLGRLTREQETEAFAIIERNARAQAKLIEDLLDLSRIMSGTLRIDMGPLDMLGCLNGAVASARAAAESRQINLTSRFDVLPPPVRGDAARLQQAIGNLLDNAIKFTEPGGNVHVSLERAGSHLQIAVKDSGIGIDNDILPHIFDRFRQGDMGPTKRHGGLGIGLSVVRSLVEMHGGAVQASSEGRGKGSRFVITLPVAVMRERSIDAFVKGGAGDKRYDELNGIQVLAIDDDPDTLHIISQVLSIHGAKVTTAGNAQEGLSLLGQRGFDVLLSDIGMPGEDGFSMIGRLRQGGGLNHAIPAASVTAFARSQDREKALLSGFDAHVVKPVEPGELIAVVLALAKRDRLSPT